MSNRQESNKESNTTLVNLIWKQNNKNNGFTK